MLICSQRLGLRNLQQTDAESLLILNADPEVMRYSDEPQVPSLAIMRALIRRSPHTQPGQPAFWAVERLDNGMFIGYCGLKGGDELGFRLFRSQWGQGYATEAALLACYLGFERFQLERIIAETHPQNRPSLAVLKKLLMAPYAAEHGSDVCCFELNRQRFFSHFMPCLVSADQVQFKPVVGALS